MMLVYYCALNLNASQVGCSYKKEQKRKNKPIKHILSNACQTQASRLPFNSTSSQNYHLPNALAPLSPAAGVPPGKFTALVALPELD
jgi:hypothetical protein